jgi:hypothetical protein
MHPLFWKWLTVILIIAILWRPLFIKGWLAYCWYFLLVCGDVVKDWGCQAFLDCCRAGRWVRGLFRKKAWVEEHEDFWHRDA